MRGCSNNPLLMMGGLHRYCHGCCHGCCHGYCHGYCWMYAKIKRGGGGGERKRYNKGKENHGTRIQMEGKGEEKREGKREGRKESHR